MGTSQETFTGLPKGAVVDERVRDLFCSITAMWSFVFNCNVKGIISLLLLIIINIQYVLINNSQLIIYYYNNYWTIKKEDLWH